MLCLPLSLSLSLSLLLCWLCRGLLSEAILALEAAVLRDDSNSEAWRMLGVAHAENDDDKQVRGGDKQVRGSDKQVRGNDKQVRGGDKQVRGGDKLARGGNEQVGDDDKHVYEVAVN